MDTVFYSLPSFYVDLCHVMTAPSDLPFPSPNLRRSFMSTEASSGDGSDSFLAPPIVHLRRHKCTTLPLGGAGVECGVPDGEGSRDGESSNAGGGVGADGVGDDAGDDERAQLVLYRLRDVVVVLLVDREYCRGWRKRERERDRKWAPLCVKRGPVTE